MKQGRVLRYVLGIGVIGLIGYIIISQISSTPQTVHFQTRATPPEWESLSTTHAFITQIQTELAQTGNGRLSDGTIKRVAAWSKLLVPLEISYAALDHLTEPYLSPARGQLLLALCNLGLDSTSFAKIKEQTPFALADMTGVDLSGADLRGIDLMGAHMEGANLRGANISGGDLRAANLWGADLEGANLTWAKLNRANLAWANLDKAFLTFSDLKEVNLTQARLRKADISCTDLRYSILHGALFIESNLFDSDCYWADFSKASLDHADFTAVHFHNCILHKASFKGTILTDALFRETEVLESEWLTDLDKWGAIDAAALQEHYIMAEKVPGSGKFVIRAIN